MRRSNPLLLAALLSWGTALSGCALVNYQGAAGPGDTKLNIVKVPGPYAQPMRALLDLKNDRALEDTLLKAYRHLEEVWGGRKAEEVASSDPVFNNELALVKVRRGELIQAQDHLEQAWGGLGEGRLWAAAHPLRTAPFSLSDRLYDTAAMNDRRDRAILHGFRDFFFSGAITERDFIDRLLHRTHRFPPQPSLFPGSLATIPIEIVNDWHYEARQADLLTWRRFSHPPTHSGPTHLRQLKRSLAANLVLVGVLRGDRETVQRGLERLEETAAAQLTDRNTQGVLMFGYFVLDDREGIARYEDPVLKSLLTP